MLRETAPAAGKAEAQMIPCRLLRLLPGLVFLVAGCAALPAPEVERRIDVEAVRPAGVVGPGMAVDGRCWEQDETPAVIETITAAAPATQEGGAESRALARHRIVVPRRTVWFRAPCPEVQTPDIIAALQRALAARGHYSGPVTGRMDSATGRALRAYQQSRGLDSARLSLGAAQQMGLVVYGPGER